MDILSFLYNLPGPHNNWQPQYQGEFSNALAQLEQQQQRQAQDAALEDALIRQRQTDTANSDAASAQESALWDKRRAARKAEEAAGAKGKGVTIQGGGGGDGGASALSALYGAKANIASSQLAADPRLALLQAINLTSKKYGGLGENLSRNEESRARLGTLWSEDRKKTDLALRTGEAELARGQASDLAQRRAARQAEIDKQQSRIDSRRAQEEANMPKPAAKKTELEKLREQVEKRRLQKELDTLNADQDPYGLISGSAEGYLKILKRVLSRSM